MNTNTAKNTEPQPKKTMTDPCSGVTFRVVEDGASDQSTKKFKPVNPFLEQERMRAAENEALTLRLRALVADALAQNEDSWQQTPHTEVITGHEGSQPINPKEFGPKIDEPFEADAA